MSKVRRRVPSGIQTPDETPFHALHKAIKLRTSIEEKMFRSSWEICLTSR